MRQAGGRCAISLSTRLATGVDYLGPMLTLTASAASIMIESGCCEAQSTGVNNRRRCVIGARGAPSSRNRAIGGFETARSAGKSRLAHQFVDVLYKPANSTPCH